MALISDILPRVRAYLGDRGEPFRTSVTGDGRTDRYELAVGLVGTTGLLVQQFHNNAPTNLNSPADYVIDNENSVITLTGPLTAGDVLFVQGTGYSLLSDADLTQMINDATLQHTNGRTVQTRYRDINGFIQYSEVPVTLPNLPDMEEQLVVLLATVEAFWLLSSDAATDIDIQTAEGTFVPRSQRHIHILQQIDILTEKYRNLCAQLNVGAYRIEVSTLRRTSKTTNRLIPVYKPREYDDNNPPQRELPHIDSRDEDSSGIPSPATGGWW